MDKLTLSDRVLERQRRHEEVTSRDQVLIAALIQDRFSLPPSSEVKVLDFGCGEGKMVRYLASLGYDAFGCDVFPAWEDKADSPAGQLALITLQPYHLPYPDGTFDLVFSTSVLEHVQNLEECLSEIHRILKPGGISMHYFPAKGYLPAEPHTRIPLANYLRAPWPKWWISLWLLLRAARAPQLRPYWRSMRDKYIDFSKSGVIYRPNSVHRRVSREIFGNFGSLLDFYLDRSDGRYARLARRFHVRRLAAWISSNFRMNFIYQCKEL
jgi:SAM-dependent methyltransferase